MKIFTKTKGNWYALLEGQDLRLTKTVFYGNHNPRKAVEPKWHHYFEGEDDDGKVYIRIRKVTVNEQPAKLSIERSIGNSGNAGERGACRGFVLFRSEVNSKVCERWHSVYVQVNGKVTFSPENPSTGALLYKMSDEQIKEGRGKHYSKPIFHEMRDTLVPKKNKMAPHIGAMERAVDRWGKLPQHIHNPLSNGITVFDRVWYRLSNSYNKRKLSGSIYDNIVWGWDHALIEIGTPTVVTKGGDIVTIPSGIYAIPRPEVFPAYQAPHMGVDSMVWLNELEITHLGGTLHRASVSMGSASNVKNSLLTGKTKKQSAYRALKRI